jgi:hypothetical protein
VTNTLLIGSPTWAAKVYGQPVMSASGQAGFTPDRISGRLPNVVISSASIGQIRAIFNGDHKIGLEHVIFDRDNR